MIHIRPVSGFDINNKYPWMGGTGKPLYIAQPIWTKTTACVQDAAMAARAVGVIYGRVDVMLRVTASHSSSRSIPSRHDREQPAARPRRGH